MLAQSIDRGSIEKLIRQFYEKVLEDDLIGIFFHRALGHNLNSPKWYEHLNTLNNFWFSLMTGEGRYMGDPFMPHLFLGELTPEMFDRWLVLFRQTAEETHDHALALSLYGKAKALSKRFMTDLEIAYEE